MTRIAYSPILSAGDEPSRNADERAFVASGGGGGFDIDSIFTASYVGDFWESSESYEDSGKTDPADQSGDLIYTIAGGRTSGANMDQIESNASLRPEIITDATYGNVVRYIAAANKRHIASGAISYATGALIGARIYLSGNASQTASWICGSDGAPEQGALGFGTIFSNNELWFGDDVSAYAGTTTIPTGQWISVIGRYDPGSPNTYEIYVDSNTPTDSITSATNMNNDRSRILMGGYSSNANEVRMYRSFHINRSDVDISDLRSWLEA